ncbi:gamma-aminobutyric acid type B receptor subunit 1-like [Dreissena polymorpha]|uniref:gamma-aminobutyric acid type B receptor subunit 1-like n=1 Tax=Dreissena polymorpha TaxID=45954 RepID=UPI002263AF4F|nr:gamma-aminobutyric acid type B receptor subunit 1-like [Dreissena polymorpha]
MALADVNAYPNLLHGYNLTYEYIDTMCSRGICVYRTFKALNEYPSYMMLLGGGCSPCTESTAEASHYYNITQLSYASTSPILSDRARFKRLFRLGAPDQSMNPTRVNLLGAFNWHRVAIIHEALEFFSVSMNELVVALKEADIDIISQEVFIQDPFERLKNIKAYKLGMYGKKIVWIFPGWHSENFWQSRLDDIGCTAEQMNAAVEGSFLTSAIFYNPIEERGIANITSFEFKSRFSTHPSYNPATRDYDFVSGQCYDHIWLCALALNCTITALESMGGKRVLVAYFRQDLAPASYFEWIEGALVWKDNIIPRDSTHFVNEEQVLPPYIYITMCCLAGIGMMFTLVCFIFNIIYRNNKIVKLSSPNINNVLLLGCFMCYATVFIKTTETDNAAVCEARVFCFCLGFTLTFGSLFSKTWRVYRIFTNKKLLRMTIKDYQLLLIIGIVVAVVHDTINDVVVHQYMRVCFSPESRYFNWTLYLIEGALLAFGAFLAWETRHVKIEALNDSHQIGLCLYNVVILSGVGLTLSLLLDGQVVLLYGVTSGCLIIGTFVTEIVVFFPKVKAVYTKVDSVPGNVFPGPSSTTMAGSMMQRKQTIASTKLDI